jgi:hypothetical protein
MASLSSGTTQALSHRLQLLPTVPDQSGCHILSGSGQHEDYEHRLWTYWRICLGIRWYRCTLEHT